MAGTVVPSAGQRMLMRYAAPHQAHIPSGHVPTAHIGSAGGMGGGVGAKSGSAINPMKPDDVQYDADGNPIMPPLQHVGLISRAMESSEQSRIAGQLKGAHEANLAKIQSALDTYDGALSKTGDKRSALLEALGADHHAAFMNPQVFNALAQYHQVAAGSEGFSVTPLGHGLMVLHTPDGPQVVPDKGGMDKVMNIKGIGPVQIQTDPQTGTASYKPLQNTAAPQTQAGTDYSGYTNKPVAAEGENKRFEALRTVLSNLDTLKNSGGPWGAVGPLGWGYLQQLGAKNSPVPLPLAQAYKAAYDQLGPALVSLNRVPGQTKGDAELSLRQLPKPTEATALVLGHVLPRIEALARGQLSSMWEDAHAGKYNTFKKIDQLAGTYESKPDQINAITEATRQLQTDPSHITDNHMMILEHEFSAGRLPYNIQEDVAAQMAWQGHLKASQAAKMDDSYPGLRAKIDPNNPEGLKRMPADPSLRRGLQPDMPGAQPVQVPQKLSPPAQPGYHPPGPGDQSQGAPPQAPQFASEPSGNPPQVQAPPPGSPGLLESAQGFLHSLDPQPVEAAPRQPPLGAPMEGGAQAPIPPQAPGKQSSLLDMLNPIGSAQAAEPPEAPNPMRAAANEAMAGPDQAEQDRQDQAAELIRQAHAMLTQTAPAEEQ